MTDPVDVRPFLRPLLRTHLRLVSQRDHTGVAQLVPPYPEHPPMSGSPTPQEPPPEDQPARRAPLALDCCGTCKFFLSDPLTPVAARLGQTDRSTRTLGQDRAGKCRRHPVSVRKMDKEWCGEFVRQTVR